MRSKHGSCFVSMLTDPIFICVVSTDNVPLYYLHFSHPTPPISLYQNLLSDGCVEGVKSLVCLTEDRLKAKRSVWEA